MTVLEAAKDNNDMHVIEMCRNLLKAHRLGWRKYASREEWNTVYAFYTEAI
jgi:hypothetical protein